MWPVPSDHPGNQSGPSFGEGLRYSGELRVASDCVPAGDEGLHHIRSGEPRHFPQGRVDHLEATILEIEIYDLIT